MIKEITMTKMTEPALPSLSVTARKIREGQPEIVAIKECIDQWNAMRSAAFFEVEPAPTGQVRVDVWLAGAAEHMAQQIGFPVPAWTEGASRFLDEPSFFANTPRARQLALAETPAAFRRRLLFVGLTSIR